MTPEELDRAIEFLVQQQAQFSVILQRDHEVMNKGIAELQRTQIEMAMNHRRVGELIEIQAERMDRYEKWQQQFQREALKRLDRILDKLTGNNPKPN